MHNILKKMHSTKKIALNNFLESNKDLPAQGSAEWLKSRFETIGGSEISTVLKINKYQNIKQLIEQKVGVSSFKKSAPLWFGNIFEYILQQYTEIIFDTKIYETGSIPYTKSKYIKYSPDGIAIINKNNLNFSNIFNKNDLDKIYKDSIFHNNKVNNDIDKKELIVLFEFKNPFMRVIKKNEIPIHYINQPRLGLEVINICEVSIFIESVFRFCSYNDIVSNNININNKYNRFYHFDKIKFNDEPISYGAFSIYYDKSNNNTHLLDILNNLVEYFNTNNIHEFDLSNIKNKYIINKIMENIIDYKDLKIIYNDIIINTNIYNLDNDIYFYQKYNNIKKFQNDIKQSKETILNNSNLEYLGIMSFKMLDINIIPIYKHNPIDKNILCSIEKIINIIKESNQLDNILDKKKYIKENI
jgi:hypothetical protein